MVFERYIYKHGKKLGPYYYQNVRSPDGKVKAIYLGTNPHNHPKHKIRKSLFFLILVLVLILLLGGSLFFLQNKAYLIKKVRVQEADFDIDQILLKVLIKSNEFIEKQLRIMNTGDKPAAINIEALGLGDIVKIDSPSFTIKPGQTKVVTLNFSSFVPEQKIEQQPEIYVGKLVVKSEKAEKEIPIVVEIETKNVLFDMNLNPVAIERKVKQGTDTTIEVRLFNLQSIESTSVDVDYFVKDINSNTIITESETVVVKTQASFFKTISIPKNLKPGPYVFASKARFGDSVGTASYLFEVVGPETEASFFQFCKNSVVCLGLSLTTILLLFALMAYFYFFIGAYLYEKVTGIVAFPTKGKEKTELEEAVEDRIIEVPKAGIFERVRNKIDEWKKEKESIKVNKEILKRKDELRRLAEERKLALIKKISKSSKKLKNFYTLFDEAKKALSNGDVSKVNALYAKERDLYVGLSTSEKREVYDKLIELYKERNEFIENKKLQEELMKKDELIKQKELEKKRTEEEKRKLEGELKLQRGIEEKRKEEQRRAIEQEKIRKKLEREKSWKERSSNIKDFFHNIGLYKTPEEKAQIALQKERERQERLRREEQLSRQKEADRRKAEEQKKRLEEELRQQQELERQRLIEQKRKEEERKRKLEGELKLQRGIEEKRKEEERRTIEQEKIRKKIEREKSWEERSSNIKDFFHNIGLYKTPEEKAQIALQKERERQERLRREEEARKQKELEQKRKELEQQRISEEKRKIEVEWDRRREEEKKQKEKEKEKQKLEREKSWEERSSNIKDFFHNIGLYKTPEEKAQIALQKERERQERLRREEEARKQREAELELQKKQEELLRKQKELEAKRLEEGQRRQEELKRKEEEKKELEKQREKEKRRILEDIRKQKEKLGREEKKVELKPEEKLGLEVRKVELEKPEEKKPSWFKRWFRKEKPKFELKEAEEKPKEEKPVEKPSIFASLFGKLEKFGKAKKEEIKKQKPASETEELEEAIRNLGLFKEIEKAIDKKEPEKKARIFEKLMKFKKEKPEEKIIVKSKKLKKFYKILNKVRKAVDKNEIHKAKKVYTDARNLYIELDHEEKKEVYDELMELYNRLK